MKSTGILFQADMIRALLRTQNPKTQTRRIMDPQPPEHSYAGCAPAREMYGPAMRGKYGAYFGHHFAPCRFGGPGDELWAKETFAYTGPELNDKPGYVYRATDPDWSTMEGFKWTPSIFMPKEASRITMVIDNIRAERVSEISHLDALAEGLEPGPHRQRAYRDLWNRINAKPHPVYAKRPDGGEKVISHYIAYPWAVEDMEQIPGVTDIENGTKDWDYVADYRRYALVIKPDPYVWAITFHRK